MLAPVTAAVERKMWDAPRRDAAASPTQSTGPRLGDRGSAEGDGGVGFWFGDCIVIHQSFRQFSYAAKAKESDIYWQLPGLPGGRPVQDVPGLIRASQPRHSTPLSRR
jgi:hypothetical protein